MPVPDPTVNEDVEICRRDSKLPEDDRLGIVEAQRSEQNWVLEGEVVIGVEVDALEAGCDRISRHPQALIPVRVEREFAVDEPHEVCALGKSKAFLMVPYPAMELGTYKVEILWGRPTLALSNCGRKLAAKP